MFTSNKAVQSLLLQWVVVDTGDEAANGADLDAEVVRMMVWGN